MTVKKIGVVCNWVPLPVRSGSNLRLANLLRHLRSSSHTVDLVVLSDLTPWRKTLLTSHVSGLYCFSPLGSSHIGSTLRRLYWRSIERLDRLGIKGVDAFLTSVRSCLNRQAPKENYWEKYCFDGMEDYVAEIGKARSWEIVIIEYIWLHQVIDKLPSHITRIIDTHDVMYLRHDKMCKSGLHSPLPIDERQEAELLRKFDCVIAIQAVEQQEFQRLKELYELGYYVVTMGVSCPDSTGSTQSASKTSKTLLFVGGANALNEAGLRHFLSQIWPEIIEQHGDWVLQVCGAVSNSFKAGCWKGVELLGVVDNLSRHYESAAFVINPVWEGTGLKIKSIEALSHARPLLTTRSGIEGMTGNIADACLVASDKQDFVEKALYLIEHPDARAEFAIAAKDYFRKHLSETVVYRELDSYIESL